MQIGFLLTIAGIVIVMVASLLLASHARKGGSVQGGGAVLIGPIPIVWGTDRNWFFVAIISLLAVMLLSFVLGRL